MSHNNGNVLEQHHSNVSTFSVRLLCSIFCDADGGNCDDDDENMCCTRVYNTQISTTLFIVQSGRH